MESGRQTPTRRQLLHAIGLMGGTAAMYQMMTTFGHAAESRFPGPPNLTGATCVENKQLAAKKRFSCILAYKQYVGIVSSEQLLDAQQRAAAQYAVFANSR